LSANRLPPTDRQPVLRVVPRPADTNTAGDIFGGWIMSHVDIAGAVVATQRAGGRVVTVAVNEFQFKKPVFMGDVVSFYAEITRIGRTSIAVDVEVFAERGLRSGNFGEQEKVTEAVLTYVALDDQRKPRTIDK
jgi:acyl-CoA thioesterase YciA